MSQASPPSGRRTSTIPDAGIVHSALSDRAVKLRYMPAPKPISHALCPAGGAVREPCAACTMQGRESGEDCDGSCIMHDPLGSMMHDQGPGLDSLDSPSAVRDDAELQSVLTKEEAKSRWPLFVRARIRETTEQVHLVVVERMRWANRQADAASWEGLEAEIREVARAIECHQKRYAMDGDVRASLVALAATSILLAETTDRPPAPKRGTHREKAAKWRPIDFRINLAATT